MNFLLGCGGEEWENVVVYDEYGPVRMVRTKEWKYVHRYPYGPHELYDLVNDPDEKHNLIDDKGKKRYNDLSQGHAGRLVCKICRSEARWNP